MAVCVTEHVLSVHWWLCVSQNRCWECTE